MRRTVVWAALVRIDCVLLQHGLCDVAKNDRQKLEVKEPMMHIMTPATKKTKFAAYETLDLAVDSLTAL
jgi:hypothetical protein